MGMDLGGGLLHPSLLRVGGQEGFSTPQFLVAGGDGMLGKEEEVETGHQPRRILVALWGSCSGGWGNSCVSPWCLPTLPVPQFPHSSKHTCVSPVM